MVSAQPTDITAVRRERQRQRFINESSCMKVENIAGCDLERLRLAKLAMHAPVLVALDHMSNAWKCAIVMLNCYAMLEATEEQRMLEVFDASTMEEVAESMMIDGAYDDRRSRRVFDLAAKSALHALFWAKQQPVG